jgi:exodeoxyribonuclease VII large subunit
LRQLETRVLGAHPARRIAAQRAALTALERRLAEAMKARLATRHRGLDRLRAGLDAMSPLKVLDRGYSLTRTADGHLLTSATDVARGDLVTIVLRRGELGARVEAAEDVPQEPRRGAP